MGLFWYLKFPWYTEISVYFFLITQIFEFPQAVVFGITAYFWAHFSNITTSFPSQQWVYTHGLGVHKATSGACCYAAQSQGPKHGIAPLACRCRYPHTHPCCTFGTDKSLPHRYGLHWLVWEGFTAEDTYIFQTAWCVLRHLVFIGN